jgi:hypothetical protein
MKRVLEEFIVAQLVNEVLASYATTSFMIVFITVRRQMYDSSDLEI